MNRLASSNWGSILTNSESSPEQFDPIADPNEYEELSQDNVDSYLDFNDFDKWNLPNPSEVS